MEAILRFCYYGVTVIVLPLIVLFWLGNLIVPGPTSETWRHQAIFFCSGATAMGMLYWSFRVGHGQGQWLSALLLSTAAPIVFGVLTVAGLAMFTTILWN